MQKKIVAKSIVCIFFNEITLKEKYTAQKSCKSRYKNVKPCEMYESASILNNENAEAKISKSVLFI